MLLGAIHQFKQEILMLYLINKLDAHKQASIFDSLLLIFISNLLLSIEKKQHREFV